LAYTTACSFFFSVIRSTDSTTFFWTRSLHFVFRSFRQLRECRSERKAESILLATGWPGTCGS